MGDGGSPRSATDLDVSLNISGVELKNTLEKRPVAINTGGHSIRGLDS